MEELLKKGVAPRVTQMESKKKGKKLMRKQKAKRMLINNTMKVKGS